MRRKTYEVLFETRNSMTELVQKPCMWRSGWYFTLSVGLFTGVLSNILLKEMPLEVRLGVIAATVVICGTALALYGFLLHGIMETLGALAGDPRGLICLLGNTALPYLVLTPLEMLAGRLGLNGLPLLGVTLAAGCAWMLYLLVRTLEVVYLTDFRRAAASVLFSLLLLYIVFAFPWQLAASLLLRCLH